MLEVVELRVRRKRLLLAEMRLRLGGRAVGRSAAATAAASAAGGPRLGGGGGTGAGGGGHRRGRASGVRGQVVGDLCEVGQVGQLRDDPFAVVWKRDAPVLFDEPETADGVADKEADGLQRRTLAVVHPVAQPVYRRELKGDHVAGGRVAERGEEGRFLVHGQRGGRGDSGGRRVLLRPVHADAEAEQLRQLRFGAAQLVGLRPVALGVEEHHKLLAVEAELHGGHADLLLVHRTLHLLIHPLLRPHVLLLQRRHLLRRRAPDEDGEGGCVPPLVGRHTQLVRRRGRAGDDANQVVASVLLRDEGVGCVARRVDVHGRVADVRCCGGGRRQLELQEVDGPGGARPAQRRRGVFGELADQVHAQFAAVAEEPSPLQLRRAQRVLHCQRRRRGRGRVRGDDRRHGQSRGGRGSGGCEERGSLLAEGKNAALLRCSVCGVRRRSRRGSELLRLLLADGVCPPTLRRHRHRYPTRPDDAGADRDFRRLSCPVALTGQDGAGGGGVVLYKAANFLSTQ
eukprot:Rhum_TRINITY_DN14316_c5_g2::Rhum_TRINITY_DN14316_c5_g2_i1::g.82365::m.82365